MCYVRIIGTSKKRKKIEPCPQNSILVALMGSFQNFQQAPCHFPRYLLVINIWLGSLVPQKHHSNQMSLTARKQGFGNFRLSHFSTFMFQPAGVYLRNC